MALSEELALEWKVRAVGSADLIWKAGGEEIRVHTTYLGDGLGSLMQAALDLQSGSSSSFATLLAEPGGSRIFFSGAAEEVYVQMVAFADLASEEGRWRDGAMLWHGRIKVDLLIRAVRGMAEGLLATHRNIEQYTNAWGGERFPLDKLAALRSGGDQGRESSRE